MAHRSGGWAHSGAMLEGGLNGGKPIAQILSGRGFDGFFGYMIGLRNSLAKKTSLASTKHTLVIP